MKIAIFHEVDFGGARRTVNEFAKKLNEIFDVDLYYIDEKKEEGLKKFYKNIFYYPFHSKLWKGKNWRVRLYKDTIELFKLYNLHKRIACNIKSRNYDYIFVHPSKFTQAPFLLRFLKDKCIYYCQEPLRIVYDPYVSNISHIKFPKNIYEFIVRKLRKLIDFQNFKDASVILANSNYSKEFIEKSYGKRAEVCYLGVDTNLFRPLNLDKSIDVLFIGNKDESYKLLADALKLFKEKLKIKAIFRYKGFSITDKNLTVVYNKSKVLVALNRNEPFGLIALEAMACGIPVIALEEGGYKESIVNNKTGFLIKRDSLELFDKINRIIESGELRKKISENARAYVLNNWAWDKTIKRFLQIIKYEK